MSGQAGGETMPLPQGFGLPGRRRAINRVSLVKTDVLQHGLG